jgi:dephospho-CoA kinase
VIGLTGGIASGKSEVARMLEARGSVVVDADSVGHSLLEVDEVRDQIIDRFGAGILARDAVPAEGAPRIDRKRLAAIVFADPGARRALEAILHPRMRAHFLAAIQGVEQAGGARARSLVIDAAILLEAGWNDLCDRVIFVDAPRALRFDRAARQRAWSQETFRSREQAQWPCEEKRRRADFVIANDGNDVSLAREVDRLGALFAAAALAPAPPRDPVAAQATTAKFPLTGKAVADSSLSIRSAT